MLKRLKEKLKKRWKGLLVRKRVPSTFENDIVNASNPQETQEKHF